MLEVLMLGIIVAGTLLALSNGRHRSEPEQIVVVVPQEQTRPGCSVVGIVLLLLLMFLFLIGQIGAL